MMTVKNKEFYDEKKAITKSKLKRCILCGIDSDILMPHILKVNEKTWQKLHEIAQDINKVHLVNTEFNNPYINRIVDDLTLKPIKGMAYQVSIDMCLDCIDKIGHRHKFKKKYLNKSYATKFI